MECPLPELQPNDLVRTRNNFPWRLKGKIVKKLTSAPRLYLVLTERGTILRRNRKDLLLIVPGQNCPYLKASCSHYDDLQTNFNKSLCGHPNNNNRYKEYRTRSGQLVKQLARYDDFVMS